MSVDTNVVGKNLAPYRRHRLDDGSRVLVAPGLTGIASLMRIDVTGSLRKKFIVELTALDGTDDACELPG